MRSAKDVDEYIAHAPEELQEKLEALRKIIKSVAPKSEEKISYGMPYYGYKGPLAYFAYAKNHIGLYIPPPVIQEHTKELEKYGTSKATVRFPNSEKLPINIIKKLLKVRMRKNEEKKREI